MRTFIAAALASLALALPSTAFADEYVFTVPVRLVNAYNVNGGFVECDVVFVEGGRIVNDTGLARFDVVDNAYRGNLTVRVTSLRPRASQTEWMCTLNLAHTGAGFFPTNPAEVPTWYSNRSGHAVESMNFLARGGRLP